MAGCGTKRQSPPPIQNDRFPPDLAVALSATRSLAQSHWPIGPIGADALPPRPSILAHEQARIATCENGMRLFRMGDQRLYAAIGRERGAVPHPRLSGIWTVPCAPSQAHDLPILLCQHVAGEIVLVRPVHDQDDGTRPGVVQSAVKVWSYQSFAAWHWACDKASSGFNGSSMMMMSAPRPVSTPPTEVASRQPCAVVLNPDTACRWAERRVAKSCRYQSLARTCRQSRDSLSARSCA
jgi:hypothetical protein